MVFDFVYGCSSNKLPLDLAVLCRRLLGCLGKH